MKHIKAVYLIFTVLFFYAPSYAQNYNAPTRPDRKYSQPQEDLSYEGWQRRTREREQQEHNRRVEEHLEQQQRHEDFQRWFGNERQND